MPDFSHDPIGIAGAGNIAQALARLLVSRGAPVAAIGARKAGLACRAADFAGAGVRAVSIPELAACSRNVLVAVSDGAIPAVAAALADAGLRGGIVLHTCGGLGPEALDAAARAGNSCGVLHPLQTVMSPEQGVRDLPGIAYGISGEGEAAAFAEWLARLAGGVPLRIAPGAMPLYHAAAVMAGNGVIALMDAASTVLERAGIPAEDAPRALGPLARASLENALRRGPAAAITGPIARGDSATVSAHIEALETSAAAAAPLYRAAGMRILDLVRRGGRIPGPAAGEIEALLREGGRP